jgi:K+-transporting ATPase ATPase C chain
MKHLRPAIVLTLFFVVLTGLAFPGVVWAIGRVAFPSQAAGSLIKDAKGNVVGSSLLGQNFTKPEYFHPRRPQPARATTPPTRAVRTSGPPATN